MLRLALKMLIGDRAKYMGIVIGLSFGSFIMIQQAAIFFGLMKRTYGFITDTQQPHIWVMDPSVKFVDDPAPLKSTALGRVRSIEGVKWAAPLFKRLMSMRLPSGKTQECNVIGIDPATFVAQPAVIREGKLEDLRQRGGIIIDGREGKKFLVKTDAQGKNVPLTVGDHVEINAKKAKIVGVCSSSPTFLSQPTVYTTYPQAMIFAGATKDLLSYVLVQAKEGVDPKRLAREIEEKTGLLAKTSAGFSEKTMRYFMDNTGIPINFGIAVLLGFIIATAIAGQTFYNFTLDNLRFFGAFKAMGASNKTLVKMILLQALFVGVIGWGIGLGGASLFGMALQTTDLSFLLPWQLLVASGGTMLMICLASALISIRQALKLEPAIVFRS